MATLGNGSIRPRNYVEKQSKISFQTKQYPVYQRIVKQASLNIAKLVAYIKSLNTTVKQYWS